MYIDELKVVVKHPDRSVTFAQVWLFKPNIVIPGGGSTDYLIENVIIRTVSEIQNRVRVVIDAEYSFGIEGPRTSENSGEIHMDRIIKLSDYTAV